VSQLYNWLRCNHKYLYSSICQSSSSATSSLEAKDSFNEIDDGELNTIQVTVFAVSHNENVVENEYGCFGKFYDVVFAF